MVADATHPFAAQISINAADACKVARISRLRLLRAEWKKQLGDEWQVVADIESAAAALPLAGQRAFLSVGRQEVAAFAPLKTMFLLIRSIHPPDDKILLPNATFIAGRGPFSVSDEITLLRDQSIDVLVSKNAGGSATYAKIAAARKLGIKVIMIDRPSVPPGAITDSVEGALAWLNTLFG